MNEETKRKIIRHRKTSTFIGVIGILISIAVIYITEYPIWVFGIIVIANEIAGYLDFKNYVVRMK